MSFCLPIDTRNLPRETCIGCKRAFKLGEGRYRRREGPVCVECHDGNGRFPKTRERARG